MADFEDENVVGSDGKDDYNYTIEMGRMRCRGDRHEKTHRGGGFRGHDGVDRNLGNIKIKIHSFQDKNNPEAYLEWKMKLELTFDCYSYSKEKNVKLAVIEFTDYVIMWWESIGDK
ncbi:RNA-directed DNA polymerase [Abeliophyllum distichum]|uniref:RNA-directed DNA polymerase n=1 Tax=Abeliophyllum distichum TaxID=126358 RepID=A0ABD1V491_9LAMI